MSKFIEQAPLILASGSVSRQKLLKEVGLNFDIHLSHLDEDAIKQSHPKDKYEDLAILLANEKGITVSQKYPATAVISADQLCVLEGQIFDKPLSFERAKEQLLKLRGKTHTLLTAISLSFNGQVIWSFLEPTQLTMRPLSEQMIERYLNLEQPFNSCGSYHFEGQGKWLFEQVSQHESTIIGLPVLPLLSALIDHGFVKIG